MTMISLGQLFELKYGKSLREDTRLPGDVPVYGSNGQVGYHNVSLINKPTIVVGRKGSIGEVHLVQTSCWPIDTTYFVESLGKYDFDIEWLFRLLKTLRLQSLNRSAAIPGLNREDVYRIKISLPLFDDQKRIAYILGKVEGLIARRKQHLQQLDDLLKSVFLEMFGDNLRDESNYQPITDTCDFIDYRGKTPPRTEVGIPLISAKCVRRGYFDADRLDYVSEETYNKIMTRGFPKANDVLFTTEGATFGFTCRIPRHFKKFSVGQRLITMVSKNGYRPEVLDFVLNNNNIQKRLSSHLSGSAALGIRSSELVKVSIPFPLPVHQNQFAAIVEKVEVLKSCYQKSLADLEKLYGALSQKAFKGELDLSRVQMSTEGPEIGEEEKIETEEKQPMAPLFELPAPAELAVLQTTEGRKTLLSKWLAAWLEQLGDAPFAAQPFMEAARQWLVVLAEDEATGWGVAEYDELKAWVFEALEQGRLTQSYDDANNRILITATKG